jgi:hypothetical protein
MPRLNRRIGVVFGKSMLLQRLSIYYGVFAKVVCLLVYAYKKDMFLVRYLALFVIM